MHPRHGAPHRHRVHGRSPQCMAPTPAPEAEPQGTRSSGLHRPPRRLTGPGPDTAGPQGYRSPETGTCGSPRPHQHPQQACGHLRPHQGRHTASHARAQTSWGSWSKPSAERTNPNQHRSWTRRGTNITPTGNGGFPSTTRRRSRCLPTLTSEWMVASGRTSAWGPDGS